jgi:tetratricopeptide (TPR) repeat protein
MAGMLPGPAWADTRPEPWHHGVSERRKQKARALFSDGGALFEQLLLREALARYEAALSHWEHPQIRLYLARVQQKLGRPLDAYEHLRQAMRWGPDALEPQDADDAERMTRALLETELAAIIVRCDEPGAEVSLDGTPWFVGPGVERTLIRPGEHVVRAAKPAHVPVLERVTVVAGTQAALALALSQDASPARRRWSVWTPWTLVASGAVAGLAGAGLRSESHIHFERAEQDYQQRCGDDPECRASRSSLHDRARWEERLALGAFAAGGVLAASGLVMVWLNRPRSAHSAPGDGAPGTEVEIVPMVVDGATGVSARFSF